jgi:elongation factor G
MDASAEEIKRKTTINLALSTVQWEGHKINFLDAPGYADFVGEVLAAMAAADALVMVVNAQAGVEPETEKVFEMAMERKKPLVFLVNHMDKEQANPEKVFNEIKDRLTDRAITLQVPQGAGPNFEGVVDVVQGKAFLGLKDEKITKEGDVPDGVKSAMEDAKSGLTDMAAESDDSLLEKFLEGNELTTDEINSGLRKGIASGTIFPVFYCSAQSLLGISVLMDSILNYLPGPHEVAPPAAFKPGTEEEVSIDVKSDGKMSALVFKTLPQDKAQEMSLFRVFSGTLSTGLEVYNADRRAGERIGQLYELKAKERVDIDSVPAGGMGATARFKNSHTGDTLCLKNDPLTLEGIQFPEPVYSVALVAKSKGDEDKLGNSLGRLQDIDPSIRVQVDPELKQTILRAMGDQQVDVVLARLKEKFGVDVDTVKVRIPYRETIKSTVNDSHYRHKKQTGGRGQFGDVHLKLEPLASGEGFEFVNKIVGGAIPSKFIPAVEKGVVETLGEGALAGYPVVGVRATLFDGGFHDVDSSEMAFKIASSQAFRKGFLEGRPVLLEPIYQVEVVAPKDFMGDIMGDLSGRRGRIQGNEVRGKKVVISAQVPLAEMGNYSTTLRSMTQARAWFTMKLAQYEEVPRELAGKVLEQLKQEQDAIKNA